MLRIAPFSKRWNDSLRTRFFLPSCCEKHFLSGDITLDVGIERLGFAGDFLLHYSMTRLEEHYGCDSNNALHNHSMIPDTKITQLPICRSMYVLLLVPLATDVACSTCCEWVHRPNLHLERQRMGANGAAANCQGRFCLFCYPLLEKDETHVVVFYIIKEHEWTRASAYNSQLLMHEYKALLAHKRCKPCIFITR